MPHSPRPAPGGGLASLVAHPAARSRALRALVFVGLLASAAYLVVAASLARTSPALLLAWGVTVAYLLVQELPTWVVYLAARPPRPTPPRPAGLSADVYVTACKEPPDLVRESLSAACALRGEHRTYLLDDGGDPALAALAAELGAGYLTRADRADAKAGNVNHALGRTDGDVVAIFDVDHVPAHDYLERTLGHFADPGVGFVQTLVTFRPDARYWIAQAAAETSYDFYNPTALGMEALGATTMMGTNSLIRRTALASVGGYRPGLAEDLATSIALHAAGWKSAYVAEPLAPGRAPSNVAAWFTQQLKWARGVFEVGIAQFPRAYRSLTPGQRLCYPVRMTKYLIGAVFAAHLLLTLSALFSRDHAFRLAVEQYLRVATPLAVCDLLIRQVALNRWKHPSLRSTSVWRAVALVFFSWPVYTCALVMALLRLPLSFRPTPKGQDDQLHLVWILPQTASVGALLFGVYHHLGTPSEPSPSLLVGFAAGQAVLQKLVLLQRLRPSRINNMIVESRERSGQRRPDAGEV